MKFNMRFTEKVTMKYSNHDIQSVNRGSGPRTLVMWMLILIGLLSLTINAQETKSGSKLQFSCVAWDNLSATEIFYRNGKSLIPIKLYKGKRSSLYSLRKTSTFQLYIPSEEEDGLGYKVVGEVRIPEATNRLLFLIEEKKSSNGELSLNLRAIDDSTKVFPSGSFRFLNLTPIPLKVDFDGKVESIKPKAMTLIKPNLKKSLGLIPFFIKTNDGAVHYTNRLFAQSDGREMVFITPPKKGKKRLFIKFLSDTVRPLPRSSKGD